MLTEFQKLIDITLAKMDCTFVCLQDILIVTKGEKPVNMQKILEVVEVLDCANLPIADECKIACTKKEWLVFEMSSEGIAR